MGNAFSFVGHKRGEGGVKRKQEALTIESDTDLNLPKRRKLKSTTKHIYDTLFLNGEGSDITIRALGRDWHLHKVYISQSEYFSCMFNGSWRESTEALIEIDIPDPNIDIEALNITFGSLYNEDVLIRPNQVVNILAAARLLQLEELIQQCGSVMKDTISSSTVCKYYTGAVMYGVDDVKLECVQWLHRNLLSLRDVNLLKEISCELMEEIVGSPDLYVLQVELDVYTLVKKWLYLQLFPSYSGDMTSLAEKMNYFEELATDDKSFYYLKTSEGSRYIRVFSKVRFHHIVNDMQSVRSLNADHIIPPEWLQPYFSYQWNKMLAVDQGLDKGPDDLSEEEFNKSAIRCGRILQKNGKYCWRWTGYSYGFDLLIILTRRGFSFKRNTHSQPYIGSISLQPVRKIFYKLTVTSLDKNGMIKYTKSTGMKSLRFFPDEDVSVLTLDEAATFPLHVCFNIVYVSPCDSVPVPTLPIPVHDSSQTENSEQQTTFQKSRASSSHCEPPLRPESLLSNSTV